MNSVWDQHLARKEILSRLNAYCWGYDSNDMALLGSVFTEAAVSGGVVANDTLSWGPWLGKSIIVKALGEIRHSQPDRRRHVVDTCIFDELCVTHATARAYVSIFSYGNGQAPHLVATGEYSLSATNTPQGWLFERLEEVLDSPF